VYLIFGEKNKLELAMRKVILEGGILGDEEQADPGEWRPESRRKTSFERNPEVSGTRKRKNCLVL